MPFHSGSFLAFFSLVVVAFALLGGRARLGVLLAASLAYAHACNGRLAMLLLVTTGFDFLAARAIHRARRPAIRRLWLAASLCLSLGLLGIFKYADFFLESLAAFTGRPATPLALVLPIGISFYTFQSIGYVVDVYRGRLVPCARLVDYALYLSFFPQVVAGPIVRPQELLPQLDRPPAPSRGDVAEGMQRLAAGLAKKALLADYLGTYVDLVFGSPEIYAGPEVAIAIYAYALQICFDFSGYSDMAIGMARVLGIRLPENFDAPYRARDLAEFWRRWHMTLSRWVRDYLFLPLALRAGRRLALRHAALFGSMLLVGLWHGAGWGFVLWGGLHGLGLVVERLAAPRTPRARSALRAGLAWLATFHFVALSWIVFRAPSLDTARVLVLRGLRGWSLARLVVVLDHRAPLLGVIAIGFALALAPPRWLARAAARFTHAPAPAKALAFVALVQAVLQVRTTNVTPFIYFQF
ncbi:MAG: MBOAT family O-acyltransferase [Polyangiaceae bacterium]